MLSAYDDLIENNEKRIKVLEEIAQRLYTEWFVKFNLPDGKIRLVDSGTAFGKIPEGWTVGSVGDIAKVQGGFAFKSEDWIKEGYSAIKIKNIKGDGTVDIDDCDFISEDVAAKAYEYELKAGDLVIAMTGATIGKIGLIPLINKRIYLNQRVGVFRNHEHFSYLYLFFNSDTAQRQIKNIAFGAAQPNISSSQIESIPMLIPKQEIAKLFESKVRELFELRLFLLGRNINLSKTRDLLIPQLVTGRRELR